MLPVINSWSGRSFVFASVALTSRLPDDVLLSFICLESLSIAFSILDIRKSFCSSIACITIDSSSALSSLVSGNCLGLPLFLIDGGGSGSSSCLLLESLVAVDILTCLWEDRVNGRYNYRDNVYQL